MSWCLFLTKHPPSYSLKLRITFPTMKQKEAAMEQWRKLYSWGGEWASNFGHPVRNSAGGFDHLRSPAKPVVSDVRFNDDGTAELCIGWQRGDDRRHFSTMPLTELGKRNAPAVA